MAMYGICLHDATLALTCIMSMFGPISQMLKKKKKKVLKDMGLELKIPVDHYIFVLKAT